MENSTFRFKLKIMRNRYREWLERANDVDALTLIWGVNAVQSGKAKQAARFISFPKEAVIDKMVDKYAIYKWELETIVTSLLTTPKDKPRTGRYKITNLTQFDSLRSLVNLLRELENCEYAMTGNADNIWEEMYRIGQRQFSWQRGYNSEQLYRYAYVYGQGDCGRFFEERNGIFRFQFHVFEPRPLRSHPRKAMDDRAPHLRPRLVAGGHGENACSIEHRASRSSRKGD
ncbi:hypothetical protein B5K05_09825 [Rhizobium phaseoli]|uniref:hypothetical protein n=1 Tax=Rhizobium phaseoli TaxID=396 RepID=UPI00036BCDD5|nr:hypothetical protein [Rhizobium phaseoli]KKZ87128.1 hypothetical protein RPHASCH2410_CH14425 [Rhizobium phaseoli Ch24-10]RDJ13300.1 hypothetical protein B5K04_09795 [Rhizobium phaseoli]RDJ16442.1 hypothetical protein B5K05_09825 [Rhizobium phaseoli]